MHLHRDLSIIIQLSISKDTYKHLRFVLFFTNFKHVYCQILNSQDNISYNVGMNQITLYGFKKYS